MSRLRACAALVLSLAPVPARAALARVEPVAPVFAPAVVPVFSAAAAPPGLSAPALTALPFAAAPAASPRPAAPVAAPAVVPAPAPAVTPAGALAAAEGPARDDPGERAARARALFDGAAKDPVSAFVDAAAASVDPSAAPGLRKHFTRALAVGERGRYDEKPAVRRMIDKIGRARSFRENREFHLDGTAALEGGVLTVKVFSVHHRPMSFLDKSMRVGPRENPDHYSTAYAQMMYGLIAGAARKAASDPAVKTVRIMGWRVMNAELRKRLTAMGFAPPSAWSPDLVLEVPVRS